MSVQEWSTERGGMRCERPHRNVVLFHLSGHLDAEFADHIQRVVEEALASGAHPHIFFDAFDATGLDSRFRTLLTPWHKAIQEKVQSQHVLVKSKIVSMAIAVINMAIGHLIKAHSQRQDFEAAITAARR